MLATNIMSCSVTMPSACLTNHLPIFGNALTVCIVIPWCGCLTSQVTAPNAFLGVSNHSLLFCDCSVQSMLYSAIALCNRNGNERTEIQSSGSMRMGLCT